MTIAELRTAARGARADAGSASAARAVSYEVEIQKKYALSAASVVLALTGVALALLSPHDGVALAIVAFPNVIAMYYVALIAGEALAERLLVSPFVAMWTANALLLAAALARGVVAESRAQRAARSRVARDRRVAPDSTPRALARRDVEWAPPGRGAIFRASRRPPRRTHFAGGCR